MRVRDSRTFRQPLLPHRCDSIEVMKKFLLLLSICTAIFVAAPAQSFAGKPVAKATPIPPHHTVIGSITDDSITVAGGKESKTYKITKETVIEFKGQPTKASELSAGMRVSVTAAGTPDTAARISASEPPKDPPAPGKK
jgi:hypothetical protein